MQMNTQIPRPGLCCIRRACRRRHHAAGRAAAPSDDRLPRAQIPPSGVRAGHRALRRRRRGQGQILALRDADIASERDVPFVCRRRDVRVGVGPRGRDLSPAHALQWRGVQCLGVAGRAAFIQLIRRGI